MLRSYQKLLELRDVIETHLNLDGYPVILSDTAGIREAKDEIEKRRNKVSLKKSRKRRFKSNCN